MEAASGVRAKSTSTDAGIISEVILLPSFAQLPRAFHPHGRQTLLPEVSELKLVAGRHSIFPENRPDTTSSEFDGGANPREMRSYSPVSYEVVMSKDVVSTEEARGERRKGPGGSAPTFGELLVDFSWRPADRPPVDSLGWLITHGYAPDRRKG
jgi:hypothetical protein